jgi:hypothetical protein
VLASDPGNGLVALRQSTRRIFLEPGRKLMYEIVPDTNAPVAAFPSCVAKKS